MKIKINVVLFLINIIIIKQIYSFSLESLMGMGNEAQAEDDSSSNSDLDSDDVILKLKSFFDKYATSVKNKVKQVDKIILPRNDENVF